MHFILIVLLLGFFVFLFILMSVLGFIRSIFGFGRKRKSSENKAQSFDQQSSQKEKIFKKTEGEYVDYEEVKED